MTHPFALGFLLVFVAGISQGIFILPMKYTRQWEWENTWLVYAVTAYLVWPWIIAFATLPRLGAIYASTSSHTLVLIGLFGLGWGVGSLTFGLGVDMLGMALGFAVIIGLTAVAGTLIPLAVLSPEKLSQPQGELTVGALALVVIGIGACSWAGKLRDSAKNTARESQHRSYGLGLGICIASGLLSSSANLGFAFGSEVVRRAIQQGAPESMAGNSLWALITVPLFVCNVGYCVWLLKKRGTGKLFLQNGTRHYWLLSAIMGALWIAGFICYAPGARWLGTLGTSVGWSVMMATMVITANISGFLTGEWKGASSRAVTYLAAGVLLLVVAIGVVGYANYG